MPLQTFTPFPLGLLHRRRACLHEPRKVHASILLPGRLGLRCKRIRKVLIRALRPRYPLLCALWACRREVGLREQLLSTLRGYGGQLLVRSTWRLGW